MSDARQPTQDGDTERRILAAAHSVFCRCGTAGARMTEIADEAGVNHALLHYYFRSKQQLAETVFFQAAATFFPPLMRIIGGDQPLETKVRAMVEHEITTLRRTPFLPGYVIGEIAQYPERVQAFLERMGGTGDDSPRTRALQRLRADIDAEVRAGRIRPITVEQFFASLMGVCVFPFAARNMLGGLLGLTDDRWEAFLEERRTTLADFFLAGLRP